MFDIDGLKKSKDIVRFLKQTVAQAGFKKVVVAVSGGVDSAVVASLCVRALGRHNVTVVFLPYGKLNQKGLEDGQLVVSKLSIPKKNIVTIDIRKAVDAVAANDKSLDQTRKGNVMARVRMIYLYDMAKKHRALVVGTENKSEHLLGYFTRYGDEASDLETIRGLYKSQVIALAKYLGVPEEVINKAPTAGLWDGQTDEGEFGFSYDEADQVLHLACDKKLQLGEIVKKGIKKEIVKKVLLRVSQNEFKRQVPKVWQ